MLGLGRLDPAPSWVVVAEGLFDWRALTQWGLPVCAALGTQGMERVAASLPSCSRVFLARYLQKVCKQSGGVPSL